MIRFHLQCDQNHQFESWFQSGAAYDKLHGAGMVICDACGSAVVSKSLMAPAVSTPSDITAPKPTEPDLAALRDRVEKTSEYVGGSFVKEARAMHDGTAPERPIYGEAKIDDAKKLIEDGIPIMPLPFIPRKKTN